MCFFTFTILLIRQYKKSKKEAAEIKIWKTCMRRERKKSSVQWEKCGTYFVEDFPKEFVSPIRTHVCKFYGIRRNQRICFVINCNFFFFINWCLFLFFFSLLLSLYFILLFSFQWMMNFFYSSYIQWCILIDILFYHWFRWRTHRNNLIKKKLWELFFVEHKGDQDGLYYAFLLHVVWCLLLCNRSTESINWLKNVLYFSKMFLKPLK